VLEVYLLQIQICSREANHTTQKYVISPCILLNMYSIITRLKQKLYILMASTVYFMSCISCLLNKLETQNMI